jgi:hypothetical protein
MNLVTGDKAIQNVINIDQLENSGNFYSTVRTSKQ